MIVIVESGVYAHIYGISGLEDKYDYAVIDACDVMRVLEYSAHRTWYLSGGGYVRCSHGADRMYLHRLIVGLECDDEREVDHINGDSLDNRQANLRVVNRTSNNFNRALHRQGSSGRIYYNKAKDIYSIRLTIEEPVGHCRRLPAHYEKTRELAERYRDSEVQKINAF